MKKSFLESIYLYPLLFAINIVLTLAAANLINFTYGEIVLVLFFVLIIAGIFLLLVYLILRDWQRSAFLVFIGTLWAAYFGIVVSAIKSHTALSMNITQQFIFLCIWTIFFGLLGSNWVWRFIQRPGIITAYLNVLLFVLIGLSLFRIWSYQKNELDVTKYGNVYPEINNLKFPDNPPDIYYIIVDGYGQADMLKQIFGWDNGKFIDFLTQNGFYIADNSQTNYIQTALSLSSSLNFEYLPEFPENSRDGRPLVYFIQHNRLFSTLESLGYSTYTFQTPYEATNITQADQYYIGTKLTRTYALAGLLMMNSVLSLPMELNLINAPLSNYSEQQSLIFYNLEQLEHITKIPGPKLVFLHLLLPHPPFIFDSNGPISPESVYTLSDAELFQGTIQQYITGYVSQTLFLNQLLEKTLGQVISASSHTPIIILQGDHGPGAYFRQTISETCLEERFSILNAYLLPDIISTQLYSSISPVNTFRLILDYYFGADLDLLPDQHYYSNFNQPYRFIEVDEDNLTSCDLPK